jgi:hypothetical protein
MEIEIALSRSRSSRNRSHTFSRTGNGLTLAVIAAIVIALLTPTSHPNASRNSQQHRRLISKSQSLRPAAVRRRSNHARSRARFRSDCCVPLSRSPCRTRPPGGRAHFYPDISPSGALGHCWRSLQQEGAASHVHFDAAAVGSVTGGDRTTRPSSGMHAVVAAASEQDIGAVRS